MKRLPKPGEVWTTPRLLDQTRTVWHVEDDELVAYECWDGDRYILRASEFARLFEPLPAPEPTVVDTICLRVGADQLVFFDKHNHTHRLEALSDGTVRLVEVDR